MSNVRTFVLAALAGGVIAVAGSVIVAAPPALAQTTLTMSSWVSPQHHLTSVVLQGWANEVEKVTSGRVKFQMLPKHPSAPPGTFDAVRDGLVDLSYVTASYTPARHILPLMPELPGGGDTALVKSPIRASTGSTSTRSASTRASSCWGCSRTAPARWSPSGRSPASTTCRA